MFELKDHPTKVDSYTPRAEKHGDENVPAGTITLSTRVHSSVLDQFDPSYRLFLFRKAEAGGDQQPLLPGDTLTALAKPNLKTLVLDEDFPGYVLEIGSGLGVAEPLRLKDAELSGFRIDALSGGSVALKFSVAVHPDQDQSGVLCSATQNTVNVSLIPPTVQAPLA